MTRTRLISLTAAGVLALSACTDSDPAVAGSDGPAGDSVTVTDAWVKAEDEGMTSAFGLLTNTAGEEVTVVAVESQASTSLELHETVEDDSGQMIMQQVPGFALAAGGELELKPGGDHIMLMDLTGPIRAGDEVSFTLVFDDESRLEFTAPAKDFEGANENYHGDHGHHGEGHDG